MKLWANHIELITDAQFIHEKVSAYQFNQGGGIQSVRYSMVLSMWWYRWRRFSIAVNTFGVLTV